MQIVSLIRIRVHWALGKEKERKNETKNRTEGGNHVRRSITLLDDTVI